MNGFSVFPQDDKQIRAYIDDTKSRIQSLATSVEHMIEIHIASYFTKSNENDYKFFCELFYPIDVGITFGIKIRLFEKFLKKTDPDFLKKNPDFINSLNRVRTLRNNFAHSINVVDKDLKNFRGKSYFELHYVEDGMRKVKQFPIKEIIQRYIDFKNVVDSLEKLFKEQIKDPLLKKLLK